MTKMLKILLIITGVILVFVVAGYVAVKTYLSPATVRAIAQKVASEAVQQPVGIGGVRLHFGFKIGITVDDVAIKNPKGFSHGNLIEIDHVGLNLKIIPLLARKIVVSSIDLNGAKVLIERNKKGKLNIPGFVSQKGKGSGWSFSLSSVNVTKGELLYHDAKEDMEFQVKDIEQSVRFKGSEIALSGKNTVYILKAKKLPEMVVRINHALSYDTLKKNINIKKLTAIYEPLVIDITGIVNDLKHLELAAEFKVDNAAKLKPLIPAESRPADLGGSIKGDASVTGTLEKIKVNGHCELKNVTVVPKDMKRGLHKVNGTFAFDDKTISDIIMKGKIGNADIEINGSVVYSKTTNLNITVKVAGDLKDLEAMTEDMQNVKMKGPVNVHVTLKGNTNNLQYSGNYSVQNGLIDGIGLAKPIVNFQLSGSMNKDYASVNKCSGQIGRSDFSFNGKVSNFSKPVIEIKNQSHTIDLDEMLPKAKKGDKPGTPLPITVKGTTQMVTVTGMDMIFKNVNTSFSYEQGIIDIKGCKAETFDGKVNFDFYYNANNPEPYKINTHMTSVSSKKILKRFLKFENIEGSLNGMSNFSGKGLTRQEVISNMTAAGNLKVVKGAFNNFPFITELLAWLGLKNYKTVPFNNLVLYFKIDKGKAHLQNWALSSTVGDFLFNGTLGLNGSLNVTVSATLTKKHSDIVKKYHGDWIFPIDNKGRATIDIIARGTLTSPKFSLDKTKIKDRIKGTVKDEFNKKKKELENKLKDLLKW